MKGISEYTEKNMDAINKILINNSDKKYLRDYSNHLRMTKSETTTYNYIRHIIDFMNFVDNKELSELTYSDYISYENKFIDKSSSYRIVKHSALKSFSEFLFISQISSIDVLVNAKAPKMITSVKTIEKREKSYLTHEELVAYMTAIELGVGNHRSREKQKKWKNRDRAIITMFINTGMRCSALYKLDIDDIDFETKELYVKEKGKVRFYLLNDHVIEALKLWIPDRKELLDGSDESALFISNQLHRISIKAISYITQKYGTYVKEINLTPHKLRATFGTQVYAATGDLYLTKEAMGHSNTRTTELYIRGQKKDSINKATQAMQAFY